MSNSAIHLALYSVLEELDYELARENVPFAPTTGTAWMRATFAPAPTRQATLGAAGANRLTGILMIGCFVPIAAGYKDGDEMAEAVMGAFARGDIIAGTGVDVRIVRSWRKDGRVDDDWYHVPVTVEYRADVAP